MNLNLKQIKILKNYKITTYITSKVLKKAQYKYKQNLKEVKGQ